MYMRTLAIFLLFVFVPSLAPAQDITSNLQGWWKFEAGTGTSAVDSSGNANTGTLSGTTLPTWATGRIGLFALSTDGTGGYVTAGTGSTLNFTGSFSLAAWIYPITLGGGSAGVIADRRTTGNTVGYSFRFTTSGTGLTFILNAAAGSDQVASNSSVITLNVWQHVVVTYNTTGKAVNFYVNAVGAGSGTTSTDPLTNSGSFYIGNREDLSRGFNGYIDEVRAYSRVLTSADVSTLYQYGRSNQFPRVSYRAAQ